MARPSPSLLTFRGRLIAGLVATAAATPLVVAASLAPSSTGIGTHQALGLPACGWQTTMQLPCPTCGMTTAFAHAANADFAQAAQAQPAGLLLSFLAALAVVGGGYAAVTGAAMQRPLAVLMQPKMIWIGLGVLVLGWLYKIASSGAGS